MSYPTDQIRFLQAVQDMRDAQRGYFTQPCDYRLRVSKQKESIVDQLLKPYANAGVIKTAEKPKDNTQTLF